jgi:predicted  nucleic acid-binding Zn-ribbon protein
MIGNRCHRAFRCFSILLCVTVLSGCSLINPHVRWERPPGGNATLQDGIEYANNAKDEYKKAVGDQALLTNLAGVGLIPLGAAALGLGIAGGHRQAVAALGVTGAAALATTAWLSSKPRQLIYIAGIKAMSCAVDALLPLSFSRQAHQDFRRDLNRLNASIGTFSQQLEVVKGLLARVKTEVPDADELIAETEADLRAAEALLNTARLTFTSGVQLERDIDRAGQMLISAVDKIGAEVDRAIVATIPDIQTLPDVIGGLAQTSARFTKLPEPTKGSQQMAGVTKKGSDTSDKLKTQAGKRAVVDQLNQEKAKLKADAAALESDIRTVAAVVNSVSEAKPAATLKECHVDEVATGLSVQPAEPIQFDKGKEATRRLFINGGKPPYFAEILERPIKGLSLDPPSPDSPRLTVVHSTAETPAGNYHILIRDTTSNSQTIAVEVKETTPAAAPKAGVAQKSPAPSPANAVSSGDQKKILSALCLPPGEKLGSQNSIAAVNIFQETIGQPQSGQLSNEQIEIVKQAKNCQAGRKNFFENTLTEERIRNIQKKLGGPETGKLDDATRGKIKKFAAEKKLEPNDGTLRDPLAKAIES